jgi:cation transport regulator ChaB
MPGESQQLPTTGTADPTVFTNERIQAVAQAERDYVDGKIEVLTTRLNAMDEATKVLHETVTRVPTDIQLAVGHLQSVLDERFTSVSIQFQERDTRQERESRDNKVAVDAAFAAQKEAAAKQDEANSKAIDKSEAATAETINKLAELFKNGDDARAAQIADLKERIVGIESHKEGAQENRVDQRLDMNTLIPILSLIAVVVLFFLK